MEDLKAIKNLQEVYILQAFTVDIKMQQFIKIQIALPYLCHNLHLIMYNKIGANFIMMS